MKSSESNLMLLELLGDHVNPKTKSTILYSGGLVVLDTQKDEIKRKLKDGDVGTKWNDEAYMHALKTTISNISLAIDSAEVSSHISLTSSACLRSECGCRAFVEVWKTLEGGVADEEYLVGVLKIKPSKSLAVVLRQFRREKKIQLEKLKNKSTNRTDAKNCCLKLFEQFEDDDIGVLVWDRDGGSVSHGTFEKASLNTIDAELVFKVNVEVEGNTNGGKGGGKTKFQSRNVDPDHCVFVLDEVVHYY